MSATTSPSTLRAGALRFSTFDASVASLPRVSRLLEALGQEVIVANARKVRLIYGGDHKTDRLDAEALARLARLDPALLHGIEHRGEQAHQDLAVIRAREVLVRTRTRLINHVRGAVKSAGGRLPRSSALGTGAGGTRRQDRQEESRHCGGPETGRPSAPPLGNSGSLRATAQHKHDPESCLSTNNDSQQARTDPRLRGDKGARDAFPLDDPAAMPFE